MWSHKETNTLRQKVKNRLSQYSWYYASYVIPDLEGYAILIEVTKLDDNIKSLIPTFSRNTNIKVVLKNKQYSDDSSDIEF
ncbi:MAG: hypothetical protein EB127_16875 [Alphaproteobacteria bacterium]|nr:hypothetical protein [Alphaproteobacteria bacterium]